MTLPKTLGFNSFLTVDYTPGQDPLIKRRAKRRKGDETETSGPAEAVEESAAVTGGVVGHGHYGKFKQISKAEYDELHKDHADPSPRGKNGSFGFKGKKLLVKTDDGVESEFTTSHPQHRLGSLLKQHDPKTNTTAYHKGVPMVAESVDGDVNESNTFSHLSDEELEDRTKFHKTKRNSAAGGINSAAYIHHADMAKKAKEEMIRRQQSSAANRPVEESVDKMSSARLKYHAVKDFPHGRYSKKEIDAEHKRRQQSEPNYHKVKPDLYEEEQLDEAVLNPAQRRQKALTMRRLAPKIRLGQERAKNRFADMDRLKHRAKKAARTMIFRKLTKGIPKDELTYQRRQEIEKRLNSPAMKARIERIALKMLPKERQMEVDRHKSKPTEEK